MLTLLPLNATGQPNLYLGEQAQVPSQNTAVWCQGTLNFVAIPRANADEQAVQKSHDDAILLALNSSRYR